MAESPADHSAGQLIDQSLSLAKARARALKFLSAAKSGQDAWFPYFPEGDCSLEATAWSLIALREDKNLCLAGLDYLARVQNAKDGGWSTRPGAGQSDWTAGPVLLCLRVLGASVGSDLKPAVKATITRAMSYLLDSRVEFWPPTARLLLLISKGPEGLAYARGWPWDAKCFHWLEPTAYCLLGLKLPQVPEKEVHQQIIKFADKFISEHACQGGGWNYGSEKALGVPLPPFRLTTAEALLALQDNRADKNMEAGLTYLKGLSQQDSSSFSLAMSILALKAWEQPCEQELAYLLKRQADNGSFGPNVLTTALAAIALETAEGSTVLQVKTRGQRGTS